jgi:serine protease Do
MARNHGFLGTACVLLLLLLPVGVSWGIQFPNFTELVKKNRNAVVNISSTQKIKSRQFSDMPEGFFPELPEDSPFSEFFERFFENRPDIPQERQARSLGSGFIISEDGYILTNSHVIKDADEIVVTLNDRTEKPARVVGSDERSDVALLKIEAKQLPTVEIGDSDDLQVGEWVVAIGSPFGLEHTATQGIVSALGRNLPSDTYVPFIQTDVAVNPGNSGGPLFNTEGKVVGVNAQIYTRTGGYMGLSFAIPIDVAMQVVEQLKTQGYVTRGWLGVVIQPVTQELAESFDLERPQGALIANVMPDSPASQAGLKPGDIIMSYDGTTIQTSGELPPLVGATPVGETASLEILRNGKKREIKVTIQTLEEEKTETLAAASNGSASPLNIVVAELTTAQRKELDIGKRGVLVKEVHEGPAQDAGIHPGDVLLSINGTDITGADALVQLLDDLPKGKPVPVLIYRGEGPRFLALTIPE